MRAKASLLLAAGVFLAGTAPLPAVELTGPPAGLLQVRRIYVDLLSGGEVGEQMRDMLIAAIQNTGLFAVTDNPERADAVLKGSTDEQVFTDEHHTTDSLGFHVSDGNGSTLWAFPDISVSAGMAGKQRGRPAPGGHRRVLARANTSGRSGRGIV